MEFLVVFVTVPDKEVAEKISHSLLEEKLWALSCRI